MRNLKRTLSLVLAALMLMSMMVVGAGAAVKDFTDSDEIQHKEAVEVMVALNVVSGKDDGSYFAPTDTFTREEMAKVVSYVMNGGVEPVVGTKVTPTYSDIKGIWSEKYIEYCSSMGIISGDGTGKFNPTGTLTAEQAAKMFLTAMGYDSKVFGFVGNDWAINVGRYANEAGLYKNLGDVVPSQPITRDDAMQMAYNAIQGTMMRRSWSQDMTTGQLTETYGPWIDEGTHSNGVVYTTPHTLLAEKFDGSIELGYMTDFSYDTTKAQWTYTFKNSANFGGAAITTQNAIAKDTASGYKDLKSTVDYTDLFGQQVKVIYNIKDNEVVYGVYANNSSVVVSGATGNIEEHNDDANTITVAGVDYKLNDDADTIKIYNVGSDTAVNTVDVKNLTDLEPSENPDDPNKEALNAYTFKMVDNTGDGKIDAVICTPMTVAKINYVGKDSVQLGSDLGARDIDDLVTYDGYAAGDWVCYIQDTYATTGVNTIQKIELQTAAVSGVRGGEGAVDYTEYQINGEWLAASNYSTYTSMVAKADVNDTIEYVALGSTIFYAKIVDIAATSKNIAMIVTAGKEIGNSGGTVTGDTLKAKLLFADGTTSVVTVSKFGGDPVTASYDDTLKTHIGKLVTYRLDGSNYELMLVDDDNTAGYLSYVDSSDAGASKDGYIDGKVNGFELADDAVVYFLGSDPTGAFSTNKSSVYTGKEIKNTWGSDNKSDLADAAATQVLTQEINGFTYAKVVLLIDRSGLPVVTTGSNYGYLSAPTYRSVAEDGKTYLNYTIFTPNGELKVKEENTDAPNKYLQGSVVTYDVVSSDTVKNVNLANVTTGKVTGWDGVSKISLDGVVSEIDSTDSTVIYVDSNKKVGAEGGSIQKWADKNGNNEVDADEDNNVRYVMAANYVVLLLVDINNDMQANPAASLVPATVDGSTGTVKVADINAALKTDATEVTIAVPSTGLTVDGALTVPAGKTVKFTGAYTVTMNASWTVNGTVKVTDGTLDLAGNNVGGSGSVEGNTVDLGSSMSGTVTLSFKKATLSGDFRVDGGTLTIEGSIASSGDFTITITAGTVKVTGDVKGNLKISGDAAVTTGSVTGNVTNDGTGKVNVGTVTGTVDGSGNTTYKIGKDAVAYIVNK
ncbi:S-layer homology domain-containing protein [Pseudoflavonifractor phocaeensis]|nr:S-layer homology domain-containing protein [Pseudoflavonifractor phocaeensis]MBM6887760.1 S-layer homology domain-containing protein [Pseudoflavonifractor phocaeensis]